MWTSIFLPHNKRMRQVEMEVHFNQANSSLRPSKSIKFRIFPLKQCYPLQLVAKKNTYISLVSDIYQNIHEIILASVPCTRHSYQLSNLFDIVRYIPFVQKRRLKFTNDRREKIFNRILRKTLSFRTKGIVTSDCSSSFPLL